MKKGIGLIVSIVLVFSIFVLSGCSADKPDKVTSSLNEGSYDAAQTVELASNGSDLIIYTLDGTVPNKDNNAALVYKDKISLDTTTVINAIAYKGDSASDISSYKYEINIPKATDETSDKADSSTENNNSEVTNQTDDLNDETSHVKTAVSSLAGKWENSNFQFYFDPENNYYEYKDGKDGTAGSARYLGSADDYQSVTMITDSSDGSVNIGSIKIDLGNSGDGKIKIEGDTFTFVNGNKIFE